MTTARSDYQIRPVQPLDAGAITDLMNPIIADGGLTAITGIMTISDQQSFIRTLPARSVYPAATDDASGALLGIQDCLPDPDHPARCDISTFVSLNRPRHGVGRSLFTEMRQRLERLDFQTIRAVIREGNAGARAFYRAIGFTEAGVVDSKVAAYFTLD